MARLQSGPLRLFVGLAGGLLVIAAAAAFVLRKMSDDTRGLPAFPVDSYLHGAQLWSHEDYRLEGRVDGVIVRSPAGDKVVASIQPEASGARLPVIFRSEKGEVPVQREQRLALRVALGPGLEIVCKSSRQR